MSETIPPLNPSHTILLVMDYQLAILNNLPDAPELLPQMVAAVATARRAGAQIGYVRVAFEDADYTAIPQTNKSFAGLAVSRRLPNAAPESQIHEAVAPAPGDLIVRKTRVGAFSTTDLEQQLRERQLDTLILAGLSTSGVVLSTVREAADRDYRLYVLEDGSSDPDRDVHNLLMQKVFPRQTYVIKVADLPNLLGLKQP